MQHQASSPSSEKPQNGIKGLRHWRYDLSAGMQVALVSLPLSLGIAIASGAPPISGVISAIIAGLVFPFLGGAYVTISGPAAGLAPALLSGMLLLGNGDLAAGYPLVLVAICLTGLLQILLSFANAGRFAIFLPVTVVEAMLAAIGIIIIVKQIPALLGAMAPASQNMFTSISHIPDAFADMHGAIFFIGALCLFLMFFINQTKREWMRKIPAPLTVVIIGIVLGYVFQLDARYMISMPHDILEGGITLPAFGEVWARKELWWGVLIVVITLTLIDGIESLATIAGVDKIDPFQRKSHANTTLRAMGVSNTLSSIFGGLTIIPGGIKSRVNIDAGGRTLWANFYNACFLIVFLFLAKDLISRIPLAAIGAILVYVGWRLCELRVFSRTYSIGRDQIIIFIFTILAILATDLLYGIMLGICAEVLMLLYLLTPSLRVVITGRFTFQQSVELFFKNLINLFRSPVIAVKEDKSNSEPHFRILLGSVVCFNLIYLDKLLQSLPSNAGITLVTTESGHIIDHTAMEYLHQIEEQFVRDGRSFELQGLDNYYQFTPHALSARMSSLKIVRERTRLSDRAERMSQYAESHQLSFSAPVSAIIDPYNFVYLRRGADKSESNVVQGDFLGCHIKLFDYSHTSAPDYYVEHRHTLMILSMPLDLALCPSIVVTPENYLERYLVEFNEMPYGTVSKTGDVYRLYTQGTPEQTQAFAQRVDNFLKIHPKLYLECRGTAMLAFFPDRDMAAPDDLNTLLALASLLASTAPTLET